MNDLESWLHVTGFLVWVTVAWVPVSLHRGIWGKEGTHSSRRGPSASGCCRAWSRSGLGGCTLPPSSGVSSPSSPSSSYGSPWKAVVCCPLLERPPYSDRRDFFDDQKARSQLKIGVLLRPLHKYSHTWEQIHNDRRPLFSTEALTHHQH